jgi:hypothetical protein
MRIVFLSQTRFSDDHHLGTGSVVTRRRDLAKVWIGQKLGCVDIAFKADFLLLGALSNDFLKVNDFIKKSVFSNDYVK